MISSARTTEPGGGYKQVVWVFWAIFMCPGFFHFSISYFGEAKGASGQGSAYGAHVVLHTLYLVDWLIQTVARDNNHSLTTCANSEVAQ